MADNVIPELSIYTRYGLFDRMGDGFVEPPNRRAWAFADLYEDWNSKNFFKVLRELGYLTVSYNHNHNQNANNIHIPNPVPTYDNYTNFVPSANNCNRHQVLALSCFLSSWCANSKLKVFSPHERGGEFSAMFERISDFDVKYINDNGSVVYFHFDSNKLSQF